MKRDSLAKYLSEQATKHRNYRCYTVMERACGFIDSSYMYLSNGQGWNDITDREQMRQKAVYGMCFTYTVKENIAMWMLYGGRGGKDGAMYSIPRQEMEEDCLNCDKVELGHFEDSKGFVTVKELNKGEFEIFLTDVIYVDDKEKGVVKIACGNKAIKRKKSIIEHNNIFCKNIAWEYEKECRLIIHPLGANSKISLNAECSMARIRINKRTDSLIQLVRSPIYDGKVLRGNYSELKDKVYWDLI